MAFVCLVVLLLIVGAVADPTPSSCYYGRYLGYRFADDAAYVDVAKLDVIDIPDGKSAMTLGDILRICIEHCSQDDNCAAFEIDVSPSAKRHRRSCRMYRRKSSATLSGPFDLTKNDENQAIIELAFDSIILQKFCDNGDDDDMRLNRCSSPISPPLWHTDIVTIVSETNEWNRLMETRATITVAAGSWIRCQSLCLSERSFTCASAVFDRRASTCSLSKYRLSTFIQTTDDTKHRQSSLNNTVNHRIYVENICSQEAITGCVYERLPGNVRPLAIEEHSNIDDRKDCEALCDQTAYCRSIVYDSRECMLMADDRRSASDMIENLSANIDSDNSIIRSTLLTQYFFQKDNCVQATIDCNIDYMRISVKIDHEFTGDVYPIDGRDTCLFIVTNMTSFDVNLPINNNSSRCAIRYEEVSNTYTTEMKLEHGAQTSAVVGRNMDRLFKFACAYDRNKQLVNNAAVALGSKTVDVDKIEVPVIEDNNIVLPTVGIDDDRKDDSSHEEEDDVISQLPQAEMRIVNIDGDSITSAAIDETLYAEVFLQESPDQKYAIFVSHCEATIGGEHKELIDAEGCPTDSNLFEAFVPVSTTSVDRVRAAFRGFHFEAENRVNITCNVNLCVEFCQLCNLQALCIDRNGKRMQSYGRRRRRRSSSRSSQIRSIGMVSKRIDYF